MTGASGNRNLDSGALANIGSNGNYWSFASNSQTNARNLNFNSGGVNPLNTNNRANGFSVRPVRAFVEPGLFENYRIMKYKFDDIHTLATQAYIKSRKHERSTNTSLAFELNEERNIRDLAGELYRREWKPAPLDWFVNTYPTVREIFAPKKRDRIVSHVLLGLISPVFERYFIYDSFSCREGKGTLQGIERFEHGLRGVTDNYTKDAWVLNLDISGYFMSINREKLYGIIWETLGKYQRSHPDELDYDFIDYLLRAFLERDPLEGCRFVGKRSLCSLVKPEKSLRFQAPGVGLPIGDVINQLNSNIYLNPFDQFAKRQLKISYYYRYVDDARLLHQSRDYLERCRDLSAEFLNKKLGLRLHPKKTTITNAYETNIFLGAAIKPYRRYASNTSIGRFRRYIRQLNASIASGEPIDANLELSRVNSRLGYFGHFNEYRMVYKALNSAPHLRSVYSFDKSLQKAKLI